MADKELKVTVEIDKDDALPFAEEMKLDLENAYCYLDPGNVINLITESGVQINIPIKLALDTHWEIWETSDFGGDRALEWMNTFREMADTIEDTFDG